MRRKALALAALIAAVAIPASGDADPTASPAARAEPAPRVAVALPLADVRITQRNGRSVLEGVPTGRGAVRWLHPKQPARRMRARRVATLWAGVQERGSVRVRVDGRTVTLRRPRLAGGRFRADIAGAGLRGRVTLRATLRHHDRRIHDRCVLAAYARCAGRDFTLRDLHRADLRGADLRAARFNGAFLHGAALAGADLRGADLRGATLTGADLRGAKLAGADLADATLERARVRPGQLRRAFLCNTRLRDRTLRRDHCGRGGPRLQSRSLLAAAPKKVRLTVVVAGPGSVTANRGAIRCPRTCRARFRKGAKVALTAKPTAGATFSGWSGRCKGKARTCRVRVRGASTVRAAFKAAPPSPPDPPRPPAPPQPAAGCPYAPTRDADDDGLFDCHELAGWTFNVHTPADLSRDGDGSERTVTSEVGVRDTDGDGVSDGDEYGNNGDPRDGDTDHDGLDDEAELVRYRSDLNHADTDSDSRQAPGAPRSARLFDGNEVADTHTNPRNADTDGDSLTDYYELIVGSTNARVPELPKVDLVAVPGQSNVKVDLGYTVTETTGTEKESASSTQNSNSQTSSNGGSTETTHELSQEHTVGGGCHAGVSDELPDDGCEVHYEYKNTQTDSFTSGSEWGFENSAETTRENQQAQTASAEHEVTFDPSGCLQVILRLRNSGEVAVTVGDFQVLATIPHPDEPDSSELLATLLPVSGDVYTEDCPATDSNFGDKTIPSHGSVDVGFSQQVDAKTLREYIANPTPIKFELGAISMTGTNLAGQSVNFLGDVATAVSEQTASVQVDFGDGTLTQFGIAAGTSFDPQGKPTGITLGEALGSLGSLSPAYTSGTPSHVLALTNPATRLAVATDPARHAFWSLVGDAQGIGGNAADWQDIVLRPGDAISLAYRRYSDSDLLDDATENEVGTDPANPDTDGDGLTDDVEVQQGWTVPLPQGNQSQYSVRPSPLSCDADGDRSADGPGRGNATYGPCPTGLGPESTRAATTGDAGPPEGTDPTLADTNADGLLDGSQVFPDVLKQVGLGGRVPVFLRQWGGLGNGTGRFTHAMGIAVDANGVDSYVIDRLGASANDTVQKFTGNPRLQTPSYARTLSADPDDLPPNGSHVTMAATGIAVADGSVKTSVGRFAGVAGSPVVVNYYAKGGTPDLTKPIDFLTTFNGTTGQDLSGDANEDGSGAIYFNLAFMYGADDGSFRSPFFQTGQIGNGHVDYTTGNNPIVGHGPGPRPGVHLDGRALPTEYLRYQDLTTFGSTPLNGNPAKGQILDPSGIAVDRTAGKLYVADDRGQAAGSGNLTRFDLASGEAEEFLGDSAALAGVHGLALDPSGDYLYAAAGAYIYKLSPSLAILARFGGLGATAGAGNGALEAPWDLAIDATGGAWVTDSATNLVQYFHYPFGPD